MGTRHQHIVWLASDVAPLPCNSNSLFVRFASCEWVAMKVSPGAVAIGGDARVSQQPRRCGLEWKAVAV